jgi:hypothetical protein
MRQINSKAHEALLQSHEFRGITMNFQLGYVNQTLPPSVQHQFQLSLSRLSEAVAQIVKLLNRPPEKVGAKELGVYLAQLLMRIREHRGHAISWAAQESEMKALAKYISALSQMRAQVAQWLTIHAAQPKLIFVELQDFEAQCWSTLGMGVVLLDNSSEQGSWDPNMPSRFAKWWHELSSRPAFLTGQSTGFSSGFQ